jgi:hypothetical protein
MKKECGLKLSQVLARFSSGAFDHRFKISLEIESGMQETLSLRWAMTRRNAIPKNWSMALLLRDTRIDCIDFELRVSDHRGHLCGGWHRHIWDSDAWSCERKKECLDGFGPFLEFKDFVRDGCHILGIHLQEEEELHVSGYLPFD